MPSGIPEGAMCVQRFDDSLNSAIHITYRISLRSSSMPEPRDPLLKVLIYLEALLRCYSVKTRVCWATGGPAVLFPRCFTTWRAGPPPRREGQPAPRQRCRYKFTKGFWVRLAALPAMIPPLVHQRRPCYDFYFL
ncbi:hypothetical protein VSDG_10213 [Cytospora chrysosperma]|uniref:Uncharacterized protein n=1 Tax=Cytospora chrysosperma TaxID=252740 RepID=A0A423V7K7_CYTCH|nr:hypothetical protein VSDG_10213 [Valsa sordida]